MRSFFAAALAAATVNAVCDDTGIADTPCTAFPEVQSAVATYALDYYFSFVEVDATDLLMINITADSENNASANAGAGIVLLLSSFTQDCLDWFTQTQDDSSASIPQILFDEGYDVFIGCKRGSKYSQPDTIADKEAYWNFNTETIGSEDVPAMVAQAVTTNSTNMPGSVTCTGVSIIASGVGAAEALIGAQTDATNATDQISQVITLAPCLIPTYLSSGSDSYKRLLSSIEDGDVRELSETFQSDSERHLKDGIQDGRELSSYYYNNYSTYYRSSYWDSTERYCNRYPSSCYSYCDWYPSYCGEFCYWFPEYCVPSEVQAFCNQVKAATDAGVCSFYGDTWEADVTEICKSISSSECTALMATVGDDTRKEVSLTQIQHMYQRAYFGEFVQFDPDFCTGGYESAADDIDLSGITASITNIVVEGDSTCDPASNAALISALAGVDSVRTFSADGTTHANLIGANGSADFTNQLRAQLGLSDFNTCNA